MDTFDTNERERIRAVLVSYMKEKERMSVEKLYGEICTAERSTPETVGFSFKTFQRFMAGVQPLKEAKEDKPLRARGDKAVAAAARFASRLPGKRLESHRVADCLREFYNREPDAIAGVYRVSTAESPLSELTIRHPSGSDQSYIVTERSAGKFTRVYDGALVFTGTAILAFLKDRLIRTARVHMLHLNSANNSFFGLVYDDGPVIRGAVPYQLLQTTLERISHVE